MAIFCLCLWHKQEIAIAPQWWLWSGPLTNRCARSRIGAPAAPRAAGELYKREDMHLEAAAMRTLAAMAAHWRALGLALRAAPLAPLVPLGCSRAPREHTPPLLGPRGEAR